MKHPLVAHPNCATFLTVIIIALCVQSLCAQPTLDFRRITVQWPSIMLSIQAKCGSNIRYNLTKNTFSIVENGTRIESFTVTCPDPNIHCCSSIALVVDRSGSMGGIAPSNLSAAQEGLKAFIDSMATCDQATLVSFNTDVTIDVFMTNDKTMLKQGVDALAASGGTALWDGIVTGINEVIDNGSNECRAVVVITDGEDNASSNTVADVIAIALAVKVRVYPIGIGASVNQPDLQQIANDTGGKFFLLTDLSQVVGVYQTISTLVKQSFQECIITYNAHCPDGTRRNVDLTLQLLAGCSGTDTKTKSYKSPRDTTVFMPIGIRIGNDSVNANGTVMLPIILDSAVTGTFAEASFTILFDSTLQLNSVETLGTLLLYTQTDVVPLLGGARVTTLRSKDINGSGILLYLKFTASDPFVDTQSPIRLFDWKFKSGCFKPLLTNGALTIISRKPEMQCNHQHPIELKIDSLTKGYSPNPFRIVAGYKNIGIREALNGRVTITFNKNDLELVSPTTTTLSLIPNPIFPNSVGQAAWDLRAKQRLRGDSLEICVSATFDNHHPMTCCFKVWVPPTPANIACKLSAPKIGINQSRDRYVPMPFTLTADVWNDGGTVSDSLFATIQLQPDLQLNPPEKNKMIKLVSPVHLRPQQHGTVTWDLRHPISLDQKDYIVMVCIRQRNTDSTCCEIPISLPAFNYPRLDCSSPSQVKLQFDSTANVYVPNPIPVKVSVLNTGSDYADSVRATISLPPDFILHPSTQSMTQFFNPMRVEKWNPTLPPNEVTWTLEITKRPYKDTTYCVKFLINSNTSWGAPMYTMNCCQEIVVPGLQPLLSTRCYGPDTLALDSSKTRLVPNPFPVTVSVNNRGYMDADSVHATIDLPPDVILEPPTQSLTQYFNPMRIGRWYTGMPKNEVTWNVRYTKRPQTARSLLFKTLIESIDTTGKIIEPIICSDSVFVPGYQPFLETCCEIPDSLVVNASKDGVTPNPFTVKMKFRNLGNVVYGLKQISLTLSGQTQGISITTSNPVILNKDLQPGDTLIVSFTVEVQNDRTQRLLGILLTSIDEDGDVTQCAKTIPIAGVPEPTEVSSVAHPFDFVLEQNYPNPFSRSTTIRLVIRDWRLESTAHNTLIPNPRSLISFKVFDLFGREVLDLSDEASNKSQITILKSQILAPGMYFYRLTAGVQSQTKMMMMMMSMDYRLHSQTRRGEIKYFSRRLAVAGL